MKKRILFVTTSLYKGGAEQQLYNLVTGLKKDFSVRVVSLQDGYYAERFREKDIDVEILKVQGISSFFQALRKLKLLIQYQEPDIIQSFLPHANILTKITNILLGKKYKVFCGMRNSRIVWYLWLIEKITDLGSCATITNSHANKVAMKRWGFSTKKIHVVYNGMDFRKPQKIYTYDVPIILTVGKFRPQKDYNTNIRVLKHLKDQGLKFKSLLVGDGPDLEYIKNMVRDFKLEECVDFLGLRHDIPELMASADVFFLPTKFEGQANVLLEAMYYGLPIVTTDIPENKEIGEALFCKVGDDKAMAEAITLTIQKNNNIISQLTKNKELVGAFTITKMLASYIAVYKKTIKIK